MQLDADKVLEISNKINGAFFLCLKENNSFLNTLLGLLYSSNIMLGVTKKLKIATEEELDIIQKEISLTAEKTLEENMKLLGDLIVKLELQEWEILDE